MINPFITLFISLISYNDTQHTGENMSNPYQMRQSLLAQAESILKERYYIKLDRIRAMIDQGEVKPSEANWGEPPTTEEIILEAKKLYNFIKEK